MHVDMIIKPGSYAGIPIVWQKKKYFSGLDPKQKNHVKQHETDFSQVSLPLLLVMCIALYS